MKLARLGLLLCAFGAACAEAGGDVKGGDLTAPGEQAVVPGEFDSGPPPPDPLAYCKGEPTWSALYRDVFGPTGKPGSCSFQSICHGTAGTEATQKGIQCFDEKGCRQSMIAKGLWKETDAAKPEAAAGITGILRSTNPKSGKTRGFMPQQPATYHFPPECIDRLQKWIAKGVPAD